MRQDWQKKFADLANQTKISVDDFQKAFDGAADSAMKKFLTATNQVIETQSGDKKTTLFRTTISINESIANEYPEKEPAADDLYWKTHQGQVTDALKARHDLLKEIIDTVGNTISGVFGGTKGQ
jgi:methionine aminopeptidase